MVKEFVLIEREEYNQLQYKSTNNVYSENKIVSDTTPGSSILSTNRLLSAVKNKVGITVVYSGHLCHCFTGGLVHLTVQLLSENVQHRWSDSFNCAAIVTHVQ